MTKDFPASYRAAREAFLRRVESDGLPAELRRFFWYHTIDLGNGLVTPGLFDYRGDWPQYGLPEDFRSATVLDAGPATGFFSFECARRGAAVTCVELPSLGQLDRFPGQPVELSLRKIEQTMFADDSLCPLTEEELYWLLLEGPYRFCERRLGVRVDRKYMRVYDISLASLGAREGFDWVLAGDILVHTLNPLQALTALAGVCRGTLVLIERIPGSLDDAPALLYTGGGDPVVDEVNWWLANRACLEQLLRKLGFREVREAGRHTAIVQATGFAVERTVLHAVR
jgi:SAM-dependent methyltransferase